MDIGENVAGMRVLVSEDVDSISFHSLLEFAYTGIVEKMGDAASLKKLAERMKFLDLSKLCDFTFEKERKLDGSLLRRAC